MADYTFSSVFCIFIYYLVIDNSKEYYCQWTCEYMSYATKQEARECDNDTDDAISEQLQEFAFCEFHWFCECLANAEFWLVGCDIWNEGKAHEKIYTRNKAA